MLFLKCQPTATPAVTPVECSSSVPHIPILYIIKKSKQQWPFIFLQTILTANQKKHGQNTTAQHTCHVFPVKWVV